MSISFYYLFCFVFLGSLLKFVILPAHYNDLLCRLLQIWRVLTSRFLAAFAQLVGRKMGRRSELKSKMWRPVKFLMEYVTDSPFDALLFLFSYKLHSYLRFISPFSVRTWTFTHSELSPGISSYAPTDHNHNELRMRLNWYRSNN